jgi:small subunit ribosomal protein S5
MADENPTQADPTPEAQAQAQSQPAPDVAAPQADQGEAAPSGEQARAPGAGGGAPRQQRGGQGRGGPGDGRGGRGGGGGRGGPGGGRRDRDRQADESGVESSVVRIYRCSKVVKGGRTFSFGALVVVGDRKGNIGIGYGKANEVPNAVEKGTKDARKQMFKVSLKGGTVPHTITGKSGASSVVLVPARPGTGVTAGKSVRPCLELVGITDILSKAYGSTSPKNLVKATIHALRQLQIKEQVESARGIQLERGAGELVTIE